MYLCEEHLLKYFWLDVLASSNYGLHATECRSKQMPPNRAFRDYARVVQVSRWRRTSTAYGSEQVPVKWKNWPGNLTVITRLDDSRLPSAFGLFTYNTYSLVLYLLILKILRCVFYAVGKGNWHWPICRQCINLFFQGWRGAHDFRF